MRYAGIVDEGEVERLRWMCRWYDGWVAEWLRERIVLGMEVGGLGGEG